MVGRVNGTWTLTNFSRQRRELNLGLMLGGDGDAASIELLLPLQNDGVRQKHFAMAEDQSMVNIASIQLNIMRLHK